MQPCSTRLNLTASQHRPWQIRPYVVTRTVRGLSRHKHDTPDHWQHHTGIMSGDARQRNRSGPPAAQRANQDNGDNDALTILNPTSDLAINCPPVPWVPHPLPGCLPAQYGLHNFPPQSFDALQLNPSFPFGNVNVNNGFGSVGGPSSGIPEFSLNTNPYTTGSCLFNTTPDHPWSGTATFPQAGFPGTADPLFHAPSSAWANPELFGLPDPYHLSQSGQLLNLPLAPANLGLVAPAQSHHPLPGLPEVPLSVHHGAPDFHVSHEIAVSTDLGKTEAGRSAVGSEVNVSGPSSESPSLVCFGMVSKSKPSNLRFLAAHTARFLGFPAP